MDISPARLPRLLGDLVIAFAAYEPRPLLGAVELLPGMAIRLVHRWVTGRVTATPNGRAVLLWSVAFGEGRRRPYHRELLGVLAAIVMGIALVTFNCTILLLPLAVVLGAIGVTTSVIADVVLVVVGARLLMICWRAFSSYRGKLAVTGRLPAPSILRWRIDFLAAVPSRAGNGGSLLDAFLKRADECGAEVVLHCDGRNVAFYRHHGFHLVAAEPSDGQRLMLRKAQQVRGRLSKSGTTTGYPRPKDFRRIPRDPKPSGPRSEPGDLWKRIRTLLHQGQ
jgi:hypothetical protein